MTDRHTTYKIGGTTIIVIPPENMTEEKRKKVLDGMAKAAWPIVLDLRAKGVDI